jgi:hypothetical protein
MAVTQTCKTTQNKSGQVCRPGWYLEHQIPERKVCDFRLGHGTSRPEKRPASVAAEILLRWHHVFSSSRSCSSRAPPSRAGRMVSENPVTHAGPPYPGAGENVTPRCHHIFFRPLRTRCPDYPSPQHQTSASNGKTVGFSYLFLAVLSVKRGRARHACFANASCAACAPRIPGDRLATRFEQANCCRAKFIIWSGITLRANWSPRHATTLDPV